MRVEKVFSEQDERTAEVSEIPQCCSEMSGKSPEKDTGAVRLG